MKYKIGDKVQTEFGVGEVLFIDNETREHLVGIKGLIGYCGENFLTKEKQQKYVINKGYENQCRWFEEYEIELIEEENKMNKYVELLMDDLGVEVGEKFDIIDGSYNPYHFDKEGNLIDIDGDKANSIIYNLMQRKSLIKDVELTQQEKEKLKLYQKRGYTTIDEILEANK